MHTHIEYLSGLGIAGIELGVNLSTDDLDIIRWATKYAAIYVVSVHNYCPRLAGVPIGHGSGDTFSLASLNAQDRKTAVQKTQETIQLAASFNCNRVVLHCGDVPEAHQLRKDLGFDMFHPILSLRDRIIEKRQAKIKIHLDALCTSIIELLPMAEQEGVVLGLENRFNIDEIPTVSEVNAILEEFKSPNLGPWLDVGHTFVQASCFGINPLTAIREFNGQFVGLHIHDVSSEKDHLPPGTGHIPFHELFKEIGDVRPCVLELSPKTTFDMLSRGLSHILSLTGGDP